MLQQDGKTPYRFYRPRRPGGMYGEGLRLEGVTQKFGLIGIGVLIAVGILMLMVTNIPSEKDLAAVEVEATAPPYRSSKVRNSVLLPVTGARVLALDPAAFRAADTTALFAIQKGDKLRAWLLQTESLKWKEGVGKKDFYQVKLLQDAHEKWFVDYKAYRKKARGFSSQGWWLILLGALLIPYQLITKPKIPVWMALGAFIAALILWQLL